MSEQSRSIDALAAAAADLATAARAARNIMRLRGNQMRIPRDPVNLDHLLEGPTHIHAITGSLGKTVTHYAHAVGLPLSGYTGGAGELLGDYPRSVLDAATNAEHALTDLGKRLAYGAPIGNSTDAIASLDVALHNWRAKARRAAGGVR